DYNRPTVGLLMGGIAGVHNSAVPLPALLPYETQAAYRERYRAARPGWHASGDQFDFVVERWLTRDGAGLDLGCGRTGAIERFWEKARVAAGIDPDLDSLRERKNELPVLRAVGDHLPFAEATFDLVVSVWVFEHLDRPRAVFAEVARV